MLRLYEDPNWKPFHGPWDLVRSFLPNRLYHNGVERSAAIVIERAHGGDFALSETAFQYVMKAVASDRIAGAYVVLKERHSKEIVASAPVGDVERNLSGVEPRPGISGPYWWLAANLQSTAWRPAMSGANVAF
jgi:hypothetical protein